jgi:hypothetical protein
VRKKGFAFCRDNSYFHVNKRESEMNKFKKQFSERTLGIGGLKSYRNQFSALELQKKSLEWRD